MRNTTCPHCGGCMMGDGVTTPIHCERVILIFDHYEEPDCDPITCAHEPIEEDPGDHPDWYPASPSSTPRNPLYGDTLTEQEMANGWHYCPAFDYLLTQGENRTGDRCYCGHPNHSV